MPELKKAFKGVIIEGGNAYTIIYRDETGMLRIHQVYWEEGEDYKKKVSLDSINIESDEVEDFINALQEVR